MKIIEVSAAIIVKNNKIFVTQRGYGDYKDKWEFPGGKLEVNESKEDCIIREIKEELEANIEIIKFLKTIEYDYPAFHIIMHCFICKLKNEHLKLLEHEAAKFIDIKDIDNIDFLPADLLIIKEIKNYLKTEIKKSR